MTAGAGENKPKAYEHLNCYVGSKVCPHGTNPIYSIFFDFYKSDKC